MAAWGAPIYSGTAGLAAKLLWELEMTNREVLPREMVATSCGWKKWDGQWMFLWGQTPIALKDAPVLNFMTTSEGDLSHIRALHAAGTLEAWTEAIKVTALFPRVVFCIYASLTPPLLRVLGSRPFLIDIWSDTSKGKTSVLEVAASVWGRPGGEQGGLVQNWNVTRVFAERLAALTNCMPLFLDESKVARDRDVEAMLYMLANAVGRGRGSTEGIRHTATWSTVAFSTGETPLVDASKFGGARVRVLTLPGSPFESDRIGDTVLRLTEAVGANYGHAGPRFVQYLLANQDKWPRWRQAFTNRVSKIAADFPTGARNTNHRVSRYLASVEMAGTLAKEALDLPGDPLDITRQVVLTLCGISEAADYATRSFDTLVDYILSRRGSYLGGIDETFPKEPAGGWSGVWRDEFVATYKRTVEQILEGQGFSYEASLRAWAERGWLQVDGKHRLKLVALPGGIRRRMVVIPMNVLTQREDGEALDSPDDAGQGETF